MIYSHDYYASNLRAKRARFKIIPDKATGLKRWAYTTEAFDLNSLSYAAMESMQNQNWSALSLNQMRQIQSLYTNSNGVLGGLGGIGIQAFIK